MGLKLRLEWYSKKTESYEGEEYSKDFGEDSGVIDALGVPLSNSINNGGFDVPLEWVDILQPHFQHPIDWASYDYQVAFDYRDNW
ncbi:MULTISPECIES: colicin E3-like toxin immunity protein [Pseudomonas]|uniref:colicin E3-like toxin immunity protein n=1 Tax=Pseudomonas TaxID=286 RepID=UPI001BEBA806|nr:MULTISPECIES: colicin E3-like toxin immunity protein [Pseudomonas]MBT2338692.1 cloacin [Pseudomonas fluorescens]MCD4530566.1 cloacin immunity family protein [Pseudomonas sp. C3-2018]